MTAGQAMDHFVALLAVMLRAMLDGDDQVLQAITTSEIFNDTGTMPLLRTRIDSKGSAAYTALSLVTMPSISPGRWARSVGPSRHGSVDSDFEHLLAAGDLVED